ncbi:MAG: CBS domain-containing protein, partial [Bacteroidota bacterium]
MNISSIISFEIPELRISDTIEQALHIMEEFKVEHLPVVKGNILLGTIAESVLLGADSDQIMI